jgi:predicted phosphodiesterase
MRIALVSDMHGNAVGFRAALADLAGRNPDLIVSLGDVAQGGPQPLECVELLRELGCPCVYGNSDDFLVSMDFGAEPIEDEEHRERLLETVRWSREQLGAEGLAFLEGFRPTIEVDVGGRTLVCCHATPNSNEDVILPSTPRDEVGRMLGSFEADAVAAGHVHLQWLRRFGKLLWFCVGSAGLVYEHTEPMDEVPFEPWSEYALVTGDADGFAVEFRRTPFDVEELIAAAREQDFPGFERWAAMWKR